MSETPVLLPTEPVKAPEPVKVPKGLIFPVRPRGTVTLPVTTLDGDEYVLHIGAVSPLGGSPDFLSPAVCFRHERLILKIIFGRQFDAPEVPIRYADLLDCEGSVQRRLLRRTLTELGNAWMHRVKDGKVDTLRLLDYNPEIYYRDGVDLSSAAAREVEANVRYRLLRSVRFHEDFWRAFLNWGECWDVRADIIGMLQSDITATCYLSLAAKAHHSEISEANKGRKDAASLLTEVGATVPASRSDLRRVFERARGGQVSVLDSLDGLPTFTGCLRVDHNLELNRASTGYNVRFWTEREPGGSDAAKFQDRMRNRGKLEQFWQSLGLPPEEFERVQQAHLRDLLDWEETDINKLGYPVDANRGYLQLVRSIIGPVNFASVIGSAKMAYHDTENPIREGMDHWFGGALRNAFREWAQHYAGRK